MEVFFTLFVMFILFSIFTAEVERKKREAQKRAQKPRQEEYIEPEITAPAPSTEPVKFDDYYGEDVPRTTESPLQEDTNTPVRKTGTDPGKKLDFDPEEMIIYSEILKPKF